MTSIASLRRSVGCTRCGEELIAPERSEHVNARRVRHLWCCSNCTYEFETSVHLHAETTLATEIIENFSEFAGCCREQQAFSELELQLHFILASESSSWSF